MQAASVSFSVLSMQRNYICMVSKLTVSEDLLYASIIQHFPFLQPLNAGLSCPCLQQEVPFGILDSLKAGLIINRLLLQYQLSTACSVSGETCCSHCRTPDAFFLTNRMVNRDFTLTQLSLSPSWGLMCSEIALINCRARIFLMQKLCLRCQQ